MRVYIGTTIGVIKGDTRSLDNGSCDDFFCVPLRQALGQVVSACSNLIVFSKLSPVLSIESSQNHEPEPQNLPALQNRA